MKSIAVFCGSNTGNNPTIVQQAEYLGEVFAKRSIALVYGGAKIGIMGIIAKAVMENNGQAIGVIPKFLQTREVVHNQLNQLYITDNMHERKVMMYDKSDGFIIISGGFGTMDEFFEIATWGQLGIHTKPIGILNTEGYYDALITQCKTMVNFGFLKQENLDAILIDTTIEGLLEQMKNFKPLPKPKWLDLDKL